MKAVQAIQMPIAPTACPRWVLVPLVGWTACARVAEYREGRELAADAAEAEAKVEAGSLVFVPDAGLPLPPSSPTIFVTADSVFVDDTPARARWPPERHPLQGAVVNRRQAVESFESTGMAVEELRVTLWSIEEADPDWKAPGREHQVLVVPTPDVPFSLLARVLITATTVDFDVVYVAVGTPGGTRSVRLSIPVYCGGRTPSSEREGGTCTLLSVGVAADSLAVRTAVGSRAGCSTPATLLVNAVDFGLPMPGVTCEEVKPTRAALAAALLAAASGCVAPSLRSGPDATWAEIGPIWAQLQAAGGPGGVMVEWPVAGDLGRCPWE